MGIDSSGLFIARTGIRGSNDLVWVGRSANYAAKLCSLRNGNYASFVTEDVFNKMNESVKYSRKNKELMWSSARWVEQGINIYQSSWWRQPD